MVDGGQGGQGEDGAGGDGGAKEGGGARACCFLSSNMRVPAASSMRPRISCGFMLSTLVIRPCMICAAAATRQPR